MRVGKNSKSDIPTLPDARMVFEFGRWFLCIPETVPTLQAENQGRVVALDPGIRSLQTLFSEMTCGQIRTGDFAQIVRLAAHPDGLLARLDPNRKENRFNAMKRYPMHRTAGRSRDLVDELHWKTCRFLVRDFDVVLIPSVETKDMALKCKRKIRKKSVRSLLTFSHYRFKQRSKDKASEFGKVVPEVDEAYTSKTASWTGEIKKIGGAKCITTKYITSGGIKVERDINVARGIFLRALADRPEILAC
jgi:putative transposase